MSMFGSLFKLVLVYLSFAAVVFGADLTFEKTFKEVTTRPDVGELRVQFDFENKSDEAIEILSHDMPCIAMDAMLIREDNKNSNVFKPGEKGAVVVVLGLSLANGTFDRVLKIKTDKDKGKDYSIVLTCRLNIPQLIKPSLKALKWKVGEKLEPKVFFC